jgi:hypothetical protein
VLVTTLFIASRRVYGLSLVVSEVFSEIRSEIYIRKQRRDPVSTANLFTNSATAQSYTAVNSGMDGAQQTEGETLFQQASQSRQPEVLV